MSYKHRSADILNRIHPWEGFLPRRSIIMAKIGQIQHMQAQREAELESEAFLCCDICSTPKAELIGQGNPQAKLVIVIDDANEAARELLDKMIRAMGLKNDQFYLASTVKCLPSTDPHAKRDEPRSCRNFLFERLAQIAPQVVVALGNTVAQRLLNSEEKISTLRGKFHECRGMKLMPTFHPSELLKNPESKKAAWEDLKLVAKELGLDITTRKG